MLVTSQVSIYVILVVFTVRVVELVVRISLLLWQCENILL